MVRGKIKKKIVTGALDTRLFYYVKHYKVSANQYSLEVTDTRAHCYVIKESYDCKGKPTVILIATVHLSCICCNCYFFVNSYT